MLSKLGASVAVAALAFAFPAQASQANHASQARAQADVAYFQVGFPPAADTVVVELTNAADIQHARDLISGATTARPHVSGKIVKEPADYNPGWSYHLTPETTSFFDAAVETCDAMPRYVEDHLSEAGGSFLPGLQWCPWSSKLTREVSAP